MLKRFHVFFVGYQITVLQVSDALAQCCHEVFAGTVQMSKEVIDLLCLRLLMQRCLVQSQRGLARERSRSTGGRLLGRQGAWLGGDGCQSGHLRRPRAKGRHGSQRPRHIGRAGAQRLQLLHAVYFVGREADGCTGRQRFHAGRHVCITEYHPSGNLEDGPLSLRLNSFVRLAILVGRWTSSVACPICS